MTQIPNLATILLTLVVLSCITASPIVPKNQQSDGDKRDNASLVCMSKLESLGCHPSGTDLSLVIGLHDDRCKIQTNLSATDSKSTGPIKRTNVPGSSLKQCPCKTNYSGLKCDTCSDGFHLKFLQHSGAASKLWQPPGQQTKGDIHKSSGTASQGNNSEATIHQRTYSRQFRMFTCKLCNCDPFGSKSHICDKRNGTCFCVDGHTGVKCDRCALGYYNSSISTQTSGSQATRSDQNGLGISLRHQQPQRHCVECGHCFNQWYIAIMDIKDLGVDMIKRTHELSQSLTSSMGVQTYFNETGGEDLKTARLVLNGGHDTFNELDEKISLIGEKVLTAKHKSDQLNLLANELDSTIKFLNETKSALKEQEHQYLELTAKIVSLDYQLGLQVYEINDLGKLISERFRREQVSAQESLPQGAYRLIVERSARSHQAVSSSISERERFLIETSPKRRSLEAQVLQLRKSRSALDDVGLKLLDEFLKLHHINLTLLAENAAVDSDKFLQTIRTELWSDTLQSIGSNMARIYFDELDKKRDISRMVTEFNANYLNEYLLSSAERKSDILLIGMSIDESSQLIDRVDILTNGFGLNMSNMMQNIGSSDESANPCDLSQIVLRSTQMVRTSLDRLDAKWTTAHSEMSELLRHNATSGVSEQIVHITADIKRTIDSVLPGINNYNNSLAMKEDIEELVELSAQSKDLVDESNSLQERTTRLIESKQSTGELGNKTKLINKRISEDTAKTIEVFDSIRKLPTGAANGGNTSLTAETPRQKVEVTSLRSRVSSLTKRFNKLQIESVINELDHKRLVENQINTLEGLHKANRALLSELRDTHLEISSCLSSIAESNSTLTTTTLTIETGYGVDNAAKGSTTSKGLNNPLEVPTKFSSDDTGTLEVGKNLTSSNRIKFLARQRRVVDLILGYRAVTRQLYRSLGKTNKLKEEFDSNEIVFARQVQIIKSLSNQMDEINEGIEAKVNKYRDYC